MPTAIQKLEAALCTLREYVAELAADAAREREATAGLEQRVKDLEARLEECNAQAPHTPAQESTAEPELEYRVPESVWDSVAIVGLEEVGSCASALLFVSSLLNVFVQGYLCFVLSTSSFNSDDSFHKMVPDLQRWRESFAHLHSQMDPAGTSLASRVCNGDIALSVASSQTNILEEINAYLDMEPWELQHGLRTTGATLCASCLFLFAVLVLRELRRVVVSVLAYAALPRDSCTRMEGNAIVSICPLRLGGIMLASAVRFSVAVALLATGSEWLASTSSIPDLILNAAGLGFIMDLDEMLFEAMVPMRVQRFVQNLAPLRVRKPPMYLEAIVPLLTSIALVLVCIFTFVLPSMAGMLEVKQVLCGGFPDFVVATNPVGFVQSTVTIPFSQPLESEEETLEQAAVKELVEAPVEAGRVMVTPNYSSLHTGELRRSTFLEDLDDTMLEWAETTPCSDWDVFNGGSLLMRIPAYFMSVRHMTRKHAGKLLSEQPWTCADHAAFCDQVDAVRIMCPITCGCSDPTSGLLLRSRQKGCPIACDPIVEEAFNNMSCTDLDVANTSNWKRYWVSYADYMGTIVDLSTQHAEFADRKIRSGCANREVSSLTGSNFCDARNPLHIRNGLGTIVGFCPATCCSGQGALPNCPPDCQRGAV